MDTVGLIPAYNEEDTIEEVIRRITKDSSLIPLVIDDGSVDGTYHIAKKTGAAVIRHKKNKGKGEALKTGLNYIRKNYPRIKYIVIIDGDLQYPPEETFKVLKPLKKGEADFVMGYRKWKTIPLRHRLGNFVWRISFNLLFRTNLKDTNCGLVGFTRKSIGKIGNIHGGYIIDNMMLAKAVENGLRIKQVLVSVHYREKSGIRRGIRMVLGNLIFIVTEGIKYRLSKI